MEANFLGIGCATVMGPDEAALAAAKILSMGDHIIFGRVLAIQYENVAGILVPPHFLNVH